MSDDAKVTSWTPQTRDALVLAEAVSKAVSNEGLRRLSVNMEAERLRLSVEARR
jgi:hypothetical protein